MMRSLLVRIQGARGTAQRTIILACVVQFATGCGARDASLLPTQKIDPVAYKIAIAQHEFDKNSNKIKCQIKLSIPPGGNQPQSVFLTIMKGDKNYGSRSWSPVNREPGESSPIVIEINGPARKGKYQLRADAIFSYIERQEPTGSSGDVQEKLSEVEVSSPPVELEIQ